MLHVVSEGKSPSPKRTTTSSKQHRSLSTRSSRYSNALCQETLWASQLTLLSQALTTCPWGSRRKQCRRSERLHGEVTLLTLPHWPYMYRKDVESGFCAIAHSEDWRPRDRKYQDALRKVPGADLSSQSAAPEPDHEGHAELRYSRVGNSMPFRKSSETSTKIIGKSFLLLDVIGSEWTSLYCLGC